MNNLQLIIVIAASMSIPVSIWGIFYFVGRMVTHYRITRDLGNMPSADEISEHYQANNAIIQYGEYSPTDKKLRS